jgi:hypothetical protein
VSRGFVVEGLGLIRAWSAARDGETLNPQPYSHAGVTAETGSGGGDYLERLAFAPLPPAEAQDATESIHGVAHGHPHAAASEHQGV